MIMTDMVPMLTSAIHNGFPVLIVGAPGIGKTDGVHEATRLAGADMLVMHPAVSDPTDFKGIPYAVSDTLARFLPFEDLKRMIDATSKLVVFIDDVGQAPMTVQAALMQLLLSRRIGEQKISDHVTFVAATNRRSDRAGVVGLLEPLKSRFMAIWELAVDNAAWCSWAIDHGQPTDLIAFIRYRPNLLHDFTPTNDLVNQPSPRTVANVGRWINSGVDNYEVLSGAAGEAFAAEYLGYRKLVQALPHPDLILSDPMKADVPTDPAVLYALCGALAYATDIARVDNLFAYNERLPKEYQALMVTDLIRRNTAVLATRPYMKWTVDNHDLNFGR